MNNKSLTIEDIKRLLNNTKDKLDLIEDITDKKRKTLLKNLEESLMRYKAYQDGLLDDCNIIESQFDDDIIRFLVVFDNKQLRCLRLVKCKKDGRGNDCYKIALNNRGEVATCRALKGTTHKKIELDFNEEKYLIEAKNKKETLIKLAQFLLNRMKDINNEEKL